jgi:hypothetical protein
MENRAPSARKKAAECVMPRAWLLKNGNSYVDEVKRPFSEGQRHLIETEKATPCLYARIGVQSESVGVPEAEVPARPFHVRSCVDAFWWLRETLARRRICRCAWG